MKFRINFLNTKTLEILFIFLLSLTPLLWFKGGEVVLGHDSGFRLLSMSHLKSLFYSWNPTIGFGVDWAINKGFLVNQLPEVLGNYLTGSLSIAQRFSFVLWFFVMVISMYIFVRNFFPEKKYWILRIFSSTFYVYNFFILQGWFIGERAKFSLYAALPLAILITYKTLKTDYSILKGAIFFSFLFFFLNGGGSAPLYGSVLLAVLVAFAYLAFTAIYKYGLKGILRPAVTGLTFVFTFLVTNAYWVFPQSYLFFNTYKSELSSMGGILGALRWEENVSQYSSLINLFRLQGIPDWYSGHHPYSQPFMGNPILIMASFIPTLLVLVGMWSYFASKENQKREVVFFLLLLFLVGLVFTAGSHPPFGFIYVFLIKYLPGFAIFRTAFYKFAPAAWFPAVLLTGFFLNFLIQRFIASGKKKIVAGVLSIVFILSYHYPYFSNRFFDWNPPFSTKVTVPSYVRDMSNYIDNLKDKEARILMIPPMDSQFNSDSYEWGYWSLDLLPRISTTKSFLANDTKREKLVDALYKAIERGDENDFIYFVKLSGVKKVLWRDDILYNNKINKSQDALFWEENLKSFRGVFLEREEGAWRLYGLDKAIYDLAQVGTVRTFSYIQSDKQPTEETFKAISGSGKHLVSSLDTEGKDVGKILIYSDALGIEATCVYCKQGEYMQFVEELSLPYINFLPGSLLYSFIDKREAGVLKEVEDLPARRIDANLGIASKRLGEAALLTERAGSQNPKERELTAGLIEDSLSRYQKNLEDAMSQFSNLNLSDKNAYGLKILGYLTMHKRSLSAVENQYNLAPDAFNQLFGFINDGVSVLEKQVWVTQEETKKRYLVVISEPGIYRLEIVEQVTEPVSLYLNGQKVSNRRQISLAEGTHRVELIYPEPVNLLEPPPGELIDISKNESSRLKINDYSYSDSYAVSFEYRASKNTNPRLIIFQDNDRPNILGKADRVKKDLKTSRVPRTFSFTIDPNFLAREGYLGFEYQGFNSFIDEKYFEVSSPRIYRTYSPKVFFTKELAGEKLSTPQITSEMVSPTEYKLKVSGADSGFILNFLQSFNNGWKAYFVEEDVKSTFLAKILPGKFFSQVDPSVHFSLDGYSNAWLVQNTGDFEMRIVYAPQSFFYIGLLITSVTLPTFVLLLVFLRKRKYVAED